MSFTQQVCMTVSETKHVLTSRLRDWDFSFTFQLKTLKYKRHSSGFKPCLYLGRQQ